jgi:sarcosine oxidase subunit delta
LSAKEGAFLLLIPCLHCGLRDETEFRFGGEAYRSRPACPEQLSDGEWTDYLFSRSNPKGVNFERWFHWGGCEQWFVLCRDTVTHMIAGVFPASHVGEEEQA